jgi:hypothetical protein
MAAVCLTMAARFRAKFTQDKAIFIWIPLPNRRSQKS